MAKASRKTTKKTRQAAQAMRYALRRSVTQDLPYRHRRPVFAVMRVTPPLFDDVVRLTTAARARPSRTEVQGVGN
jgi:hypothetical protein